MTSTLVAPAAATYAGTVLKPARIVMNERKLQVQRPRLRDKRGKEVPIPAYDRLHDNSRLMERMYDIMVNGVSTRRYDEVLPEMANTVGISKSSVSRQFVKKSKKKLVELMERRFEDRDILAIYVDGIIVDGRHILAVIDVESDAQKHLMGLVSGSSENAEAVKDLLNSLIERGLATGRECLFVIDGSRALRSAIEAVFGERAHAQRCRTHKIRNVTERLPKPTRQQTASVMRAAYKPPVDEGIARLKAQAAWLKADHPDAAASLLEGLEETFTVNRLDPTPRLTRSLATTNLIENPNGARYDASALGSIAIIETPLSRRRHGGAMGGHRLPGSPEALPKTRRCRRSLDARRRLASSDR